MYNLVPGKSNIQSQDEIDISVKIFEGITNNFPVVLSGMYNIDYPIEYLEENLQSSNVVCLPSHYSAGMIINTLSLLCFRKTIDNKFIGIYVGRNEERDTELYSILKNSLFLHNIFFIMSYVNAYDACVLDKIKNLKENFPNNKIIVGSSYVKSSVAELIESGADGILFSQVLQVKVLDFCGIGSHPIDTIKMLRKEINEYNAKNAKNVTLAVEFAGYQDKDIVLYIAAGADFVFNLPLFNSEHLFPEVNRSYLSSFNDSVALQHYIIPDSTSGDNTFTVSCDMSYKRKIGDLHDAYAFYSSWVKKTMRILGCKNIAELQEYGSFDDSWVEVKTEPRVV